MKITRHLPKEEIKALPPFAALSLAQITLVRDEAGLAAAIDALQGHAVLGFDTESRPTFHKGQQPTGPHLVQLASADAFGERDEALVTTMPKADFPPGIKVGGQIRRMGPDGEPRYYFVTKIKGPTVLLDGNHPLCGKSLRFAIKVLDVRAATEEEIAHQHVHGEHGHQH